MSTEVTMRELPDCDVCPTRGVSPAGEASYDGKTVYGPWAYMCEPCWAAVGVGRLGTGYGQRLVLSTTT